MESYFTPHIYAPRSCPSGNAHDLFLKPQLMSLVWGLAVSMNADDNRKLGSLPTVTFLLSTFFWRNYLVSQGGRDGGGEKGSNLL